MGEGLVLLCWTTAGFRVYRIYRVYRVYRVYGVYGFGVGGSGWGCGVHA